MQATDNSFLIYKNRAAAERALVKMDIGEEDYRILEHRPDHITIALFVDDEFVGNV
jgi:hypothetical protein